MKMRKVCPGRDFYLWMIFYTVCCRGIWEWELFSCKIRRLSHVWNTRQKSKFFLQVWFNWIKIVEKNEWGVSGELIRGCLLRHRAFRQAALCRCPKITSRSCLPCCPSSAFQQELHNPAMRPLLRLEYEQHCCTKSVTVWSSLDCYHFLNRG